MSEDVQRIVAEHPFWQGIDPQVIPSLVASAQINRYGVGKVIFQERQEARNFYLLHKGHVAVETFVPGEGVSVLTVLHPGEALGWSWLFPPYRWQFSARSVDATEVIVHSADQLRKLAQENPAFGKELVTRMAQVLLERLKATREKLEELRVPECGAHIDECLGEPEDADPYDVPTSFRPKT
ncbi:MAG: cyclic nucleotide-binding domain-containing protein [Verrucomicrobia bacterium]|nr:cyclic nucleotide-binding domain-containing protein [Verrucomicrobiota bacterium]